MPVYFFCTASAGATPDDNLHGLTPG